MEQQKSPQRNQKQQIKQIKMFSNYVVDLEAQMKTKHKIKLGLAQRTNSASPIPEWDDTTLP